MNKHEYQSLLETILSFYAKDFLNEQNDWCDQDEAACAVVHDEWVKRNAWAPDNLKVPYADLPEDEKEKDRDHVRIMKQLRKEMPDADDEALADRFGSMAHAKWREGFEGKEGKGAKRMKKTKDGEVNINVPWEELHSDYKRENLDAGRVAARVTK